MSGLADPAAQEELLQKSRSRRFRLAPEPGDEAMERRRLEQDLRHTLSQDAFILHYQPRVALTSGATSGAEALIRWPHRKRGMVSPALFLPVAERSALGTRIGGWVLRAACEEAARWPPAATLSVNVSARHLLDGALLEQMAAALDASGLEPERLELEIAESVLIAIGDDPLLTLSAIRDLGVGIALDNFGTGSASLNVLTRLPLTSLKLDRCMTRPVPRDREAAAIVRAVLDSGHALGLGVVAEGIETEAQRAFLAGIGCDEGQGHLFSQALPPAQVRERLRR